MIMDSKVLKKAIADAKGWSVYHYDKGPRGYYMLVDESVSPVNYLYPDNERQTESEVWEKDCPAWPNSIAAAWELVEEALSQGVLCEVSNSTSSTGPAGTNETLASWSSYCAIFYVFDDDDEMTKTKHIAVSETAPIAICCAWLAWKGAKTNER